MSYPTNPAKRYHAHITRAMIRASASSVKIVVPDHTQCPECKHWIPNGQIIDGVFPEHYIAGKIPCGWRNRR